MQEKTTMEGGLLFAHYVRLLSRQEAKVSVIFQVDYMTAVVKQE